MRKKTNDILIISALMLLGGSGGHTVAETPAPEEKSRGGVQSQSAPGEPKPLTQGLPERELSEKEQKRREERLKKELESTYRKWLEEDVVYIIAPEEKEAFLELSNDEERGQFIEQFWLRRDPTPETIENEFREEHYRRIVYANELFTSGVEGWRTDRGRIYIMFGPPDEIETHAMGGGYWRRAEEGGGQTSTYPFERWFYRHIDGVSDGVELEFVDKTMSGQYRLSVDPSEKDALAIIPGAGLSALEDQGLAFKSERFTRSDGTMSPTTVTDRRSQNFFERMQLWSSLHKPPAVKFKDLEALVETRISFNLLPFEARIDFIRITDSSILVPVTVALPKKNVTFQMQNGLHVSVVNVFGRITTLTGRIVHTFEDVLRLELTPELLQATLEEPALYQKALPLSPGLYKLNLVLKDLNSGNVGTAEFRLAVPRFEEDELAHSSLVLADGVERLASRHVGSEQQFVIGDTKVRPSVGQTFRPTQRMGIYLQVYNLGVDETTHQPDATIDYTIRRGDETLFRHTESTTDMEHAGQQLTLRKVLPLTPFKPGEYKLEIKVTDRVRQQSIDPSATFRVTP